MLRTNVLGYSIFNCFSLLLCVRWLLFLLLWIWWIYLDLSVREMRRVGHFSISFAILPRLGSNTKREKNACYSCFLGPRPFAITSSSLLFHFIVLCLSYFRFSTFFTSKFFCFGFRIRSLPCYL